MNRVEFGRRSLLRGAGAAAAVAAGTQLTGCSDREHTANTTANNKKVRLPRFRAVTGVHPDLRGTASGVPDAFLSFPDPVVKKQRKPGNGDTVTAMLEAGAAIGPISRNKLLGEPAAWTRRNGKFVRAYELPEYQRALEIVSTEWKKGIIFHRDSFSMPGTKQEDMFANGSVLLDFRANTFWQNYYIWYAASFPELDLGAVLPADYDGKGMGRKGLGTGAYTFTALKKASPARIKELLRIMNFTAAPFGTEQYMFVKFGIPGRDYTIKNGDPVPTETGSEVALPISYIAARPPVLYTPGHPDATRREYEYQVKVMKYGVKDASAGLTSDTYSRSSATLEAAIGDVITGILQGNRPLSDWEPAVAKWRKDGGDRIRSEYEQAYADLHR